jgi:hypothetical protein
LALPDFVVAGCTDLMGVTDRIYHAPWMHNSIRV